MYDNGGYDSGIAFVLENDNIVNCYHEIREECDKETLRQALERTTKKRGSGAILTDYMEILKEIRESDTLRKLWEKYRREYDYAKDISFEDTCNTVQEIMKAIIL